MTDRIDVIAALRQERAARRMGDLMRGTSHQRPGGIQIDASFATDHGADVDDSPPVEVETFVADSLRARARRLEIEAATGIGPDNRLRYHGRVSRGIPPRRAMDDQDLAFAIDELQRARTELAVAHEIDAPAMQKQGAINCATDRVRFAVGFALDLLDRHEDSPWSRSP